MLKGVVVVVFYFLTEECGCTTQLSWFSLRVCRWKKELKVSEGFIPFWLVCSNMTSIDRRFKEKVLGLRAAGPSL